MNPILANVMMGWSFVDIATALVVCIGIVAVVFIVIRVAKIPIPEWFWHVLAIVAVCFVAVVAIRFLASM